jgi:heme/copper-type cytochrome/quinol oxidase subunit 3
VTSISKLDFRPPRRAANIGMWLLLAALGMLFVSGMLLYVLFYLHVFGNAATIPVHLPAAMWISTAVLLVASCTIHRAVAAVRRQRLTPLLHWLYATSALAAVFLAIQFPCLAKVLAAYRAATASIVAQTSAATHPLRLDGLVFCLILLHALHVIGGIVAMGIVTVNVYRGRYDHEHYTPIRHAAWYWHFLDGVWLTMFAIFLTTR